MLDWLFKLKEWWSIKRLEHNIRGTRKVIYERNNTLILSSDGLLVPINFQTSEGEINESSVEGYLNQLFDGSKFLLQTGVWLQCTTMFPIKI